MLAFDLWVWPGIGKHEGKDFVVTEPGAPTVRPTWDVSDPPI